MSVMTPLLRARAIQARAFHFIFKPPRLAYASGSDEPNFVARPGPTRYQYTNIDAYRAGPALATISLSRPVVQEA
jgi:hypothetical protein